MEKLALIYDYDQTLTTQDSTFCLEELGVNHSFYEKVEKYRSKSNMEMILSCMYLIWKGAKEKNMPLTKKFLNGKGKTIKFFNGVETWFERINKFGKQHGFQVEHYIVSSGMREIIEGGAIAKNFKKIFASEYHYDEDGFADWPLASVNYTNKTQFIYRINKGLLNNLNDEELNDFMENEKRAVHYKNMIYFGDGLTDVPCMKTMKDRNGFAIAVYSTNSKRATNLLKHGRCDHACFADFSENSELETIVKNRILELEKKR